MKYSTAKMITAVAVPLVLIAIGIHLLKTAHSSSGGIFLTADQQGQRHFQRKEYREAAVLFQDPMWQGTALYRDGEFEKAARAFSRRDTAEAHFNQGNALLMHGDYEGAITCYDQALERRAEWNAAVENRAIAVARGERTRAEGGDMGDQTLGADDMVFDLNANNEEGQDTQVTSSQAMSDQQIQALWLRRVQTRPADFLKAKFTYQQAAREERP